MSKLKFTQKVPHADNAIFGKAVGISDYSIVVYDFDDVFDQIIDGVFFCGYDAETVDPLWGEDLSG